jgi:molybdopterin synthase sulfur carrier subunit
VDEPTSVETALAALCAAYPPLAERVLTDGTLRAEVNLLCNGEACALDAPVGSGDELALFPPVSGG